MRFIDVEASGLDGESYPIQIGWYDTDTKKGREHLIKPHKDWSYWSESAEMIHGYSKELITTLGRDGGCVCEALNGELSGMTLYSDASHFDRFWISKLFKVHNRKMLFTVESAEKLIPKEFVERYTYDMTYLDREHSALSDAKIFGEWLMNFVSKHKPK